MSTQISIGIAQNAWKFRSLEASKPN